MVVASTCGLQCISAANIYTSNYKWKKSLSVCLSVCLSIVMATIHPIDFTLGGCIAEDPRKRSVEYEFAWMCGSQENCKQQ